MTKEAIENEPLRPVVVGGENENVKESTKDDNNDNDDVEDQQQKQTFLKVKETEKESFGIITQDYDDPHPIKEIIQDTNLNNNLNTNLNTIRSSFSSFKQSKSSSTTSSSSSSTSCCNRNTISTFLDCSASILISTLVVSYWRGTWLIFDIYLCDQPYNATILNSSNYCNSFNPAFPPRITSGYVSYIIGILLLLIAMLLTWKFRLWSIQHREQLTLDKVLWRFVIVYILGISSVNTWRGVWYLTDYLIPASVVPSWVLVLIAIGVSLVMGTFQSVLACPAIFLLDGPGYSSPPFLETVMETKLTITLPKDVSMPPYKNEWIKIGDVVYSFVLLPILVVWFWRGVWYGLDVALWGRWGEDNEYSEEDSNVPSYVINFAYSLVFGSLVAMLGLILGSKDMLLVFIRCMTNTNTLYMKIFKRMRTLVLAVATISYWRVIWYVWDEYLGLSTQWSAWVSHCLGVVGLVALGSFSSVTAPVFTIGVDDIAHENAADEPLFHDIPVPQESLFFMAIGRQPPSMLHLYMNSGNNGVGAPKSRRHVLSSSLRGSVVSGGDHASSTAAPTNHRQDVFAKMSGRSYAIRKQSTQYIRSR